MSDQVKFHEFMTAELLSQSGLHQMDKNWTDLYGNGHVTDGVLYNEAGVVNFKGSDWDADMEAQDYDTFEEFKI